MTQYLDATIFAGTEPLDMGILASQEITSASNAMDVLGPLNRASSRVQNVVTILHITEDGEVAHAKLAMCGKLWSRKFDAKRLFVNAPRGAKLVVKSLDTTTLEFPPGEKHSLWIPSTQFDWAVNKGNNKEDGSYTQAELRELGITDWSLRAQVQVSDSPSLATIRWVAIPLPVEDLSSLPGDASKPGYPVIAISDGEAQMAGIPNPTRNDGLPMYPAIINDGPTTAAICLPTSEEIVQSMRFFWSTGTTIRALNAKDWAESTKGPSEPISDRGVPAWAWPPQEQILDGDTEPSEDECEPVTASLEDMDREDAERVAQNVIRELGMDNSLQITGRVNGGREESRPHVRVSPGATGGSGSGSKRRRGSQSEPPSKRSGPLATAATPPLNSDILQDEKLWPDNFTKEMLNSISLENAINLRKMQDRQKKDDEKTHPGVTVSKPDLPIKVVHLDAGEDNAKDILHESRFKLRPIASPPVNWYAARVQKIRKDRPRNPNVSHLGATQQISPSTWYMANDRRLTLMSRHFFADNFGVENKTAKNKTGIKNGQVETTSEYDYTEVKSMADMLNVVVNYMTVQHMTWQEDYTGILILKVAVKYHLFREGKQNALNIFNQFFNRVLAYNAINCHEGAPADYKTVEDIAKEVMLRWDCSIQPPIYGDILNHNTHFSRVDSNSTGVSGMPGGGRGNGDRSLDRLDRLDRGRGDGNRQQLLDKKLKVGQVPPKFDQFKMGALKLCKWFNMERGCNKPVENGSCSFNGNKFLHNCAIVTSVKDGNIRLCGKSHAAKDHK